MSSTDKNKDQRSLFDDDNKEVYKRRVNQRNLDDIYPDELDLDDLLPPEYQSRPTPGKNLIK